LRLFLGEQHIDESIVCAMRSLKWSVASSRGDGQGLGSTAIAKALGIGLASVYRVMEAGAA